MKQKLTIICLRTTKVSDKTSILNAYSLEAGRVSFAIPAGAGREAARRRALLMPLSVVECQADMRPGRELLFMSEPVARVAMERVYSNPVKNAVAMFLAEFMSVVLRDSVADTARFAFVADAVGRLAGATTRQAANFHICFLLGLGRFLGVEPDYSTAGPGRVFDLTDGVFKRVADATRASDFLTPDESVALSRLSRMTFDNLGAFRFSRADRRRILELILRFYGIHVAPVGSLRSFDVLQTLF